MLSVKAGSFAESQDQRNSLFAVALSAVGLASDWLLKDLAEKNTCVDDWPKATSRYFQPPTFKSDHEEHKLLESIRLLQKTVTQVLVPTFGSKLYVRPHIHYRSSFVRWSKPNQSEPAGFSTARQDLSNKAFGFAGSCKQYRASKESAWSAQNAKDEEWAGFYGVENNEASQWGEEDITAGSILAKRESILAKVREMATAVASVSDKLAAQRGKPR
jgi:hypothetical protein